MDKYKLPKEPSYEDYSKVRKALQKDGKAPSWYSTASYQLLVDKNYLETIDGKLETPKDMYTRIAKQADKLTKFKLPKNYGYASWCDAYFEVMWKGWLSPSTTVLTNMGSDRGHPISCLTGDSWIHTENYGGTLMKDLKIGDKVLTHTGTFKPVTHIQTRQSTDDLYELKVATRTTPIKITGNHPVKTNEGWVNVDKLNPKRHLIATNDVIQYDETPFVIDMKKYVNYKYKVVDGWIYQVQDKVSTKPSRQLKDGIVTNQNKPIKEFVEVTEDLAWALGLWLAEGSHMVTKNVAGEEVLTGIRITMNVNELEYLEKWANIIKSSFGVYAKVFTQGRKGCEHAWGNTNVSSHTIATFIYTEFGRGSKVKNVPNWLKLLPKKHLKNVIDGVYRGDGKKVTKNSTYITLTNTKLVMSLYEIGLKADLRIGLQMQEKAGVGATVVHVQRLNLYDYKLGTSSTNIHSIPFYDGLRYCPFKIKKLDYNTKVYDITVAEDHSFSVSGVVVHNCSGSSLPDSIRGMYQARLEIAQLTQRGYGTSWALDAVRHRGSVISKGGTANGAMQPAAGIAQDMFEISQGNSRRGNVGQYLNIMHGDFDEMVNQLQSDDDGWNVGWNFDHKFKDALKNDFEEADRRWSRVMRTKMLKGKGYMLFLDKVNKYRPLSYERLDYYVTHSNLCVAGDTKILTRDGYKPIEDVAGSMVECWNGKEWSSTEIVKTSDGQKVMTVSLSNNTNIVATPYHKWYVQESYHGKPVEKRTHELVLGDKLIKFDLEPVTHGTKELTYAYENGFHTGDGTVYKNSNKSRISLHDDKQLLFPRFHGHYNSSKTKEGRILNLYYDAGVLEDKFFIPDSSYSVDSRLSWLAGYLDADGTLTNNVGAESIQVVSVKLDFLQEVMLLLQELGVHSTISKGSDAGYKRLPANDGSGEIKDFWCKQNWRLLIAGSELQKLLELGFKPSRVIPTNREYQRSARKFVTVTSVTDEGAEIPTYCGVEPKEHKLMFNGVLTGQCAEIALMNDKEHSFTCVLSSMVVNRYDEWKGTKAVQIATVFLDAVIEDMLIKAHQEEGFERIIAFTEKSRAIGLGQLGQSTYFQQQSWVFSELQTIMFNQQLQKLLDDRTLEASKLMAKELGEPEWLKGDGIRNSHRLSNPPTKSTAIIQGGPSEGTDPVFANVYEQDTAGGIVYRINPPFLKLMKEKGHYDVETMKRIAEDNGSVQAEDWLTDHEKKVFRTAFELDQETLLQFAADRQKAMVATRGGQGQSTNLYFPHDAKEEEISRIHWEAYKNPFIFGLYYVRSLNGASKVKVIPSTCEACEG